LRKCARIASDVQRCLAVGLAVDLRSDRSCNADGVLVLIQQRLGWCSVTLLVLLTPVLIRRDELPVVPVLSGLLLQRCVAVVFQKYLREFISNLLQYRLFVGL